MTHNGTSFDFQAAGRPGAGEALLVPLVTKPKPPMQLVSQVDALCDGAVAELLDVRALREDAGSLAHTTRSGPYRRVLAVSLGDDSELTVAKVRDAAACAARWLISSKVGKAALWLDGLLSCRLENAAAEWADGMTIAGFRYGEFKKAENNHAPPRLRLGVHASQPEHVERSLGPLREGVKLAECVNYVRGIAHMPPNRLNPTTLAEEARKLARQHGLKCTVIEAAQARKMGMNGLLAVGMASDHPPCLIRLEYRGAPKSRSNTVLVGKAITFDTGGISIKPAAGMESMKFDKCGGCAVLGVLKAVATLKLRCNVIGLLAAAENVISDEAYRPSDILRMASGKTVEVTNTDAEGRLVLADALWYAQEHCRPTTLIDLATLTGGVVTALGKTAAGLMFNNEALADELQECGRQTHERVWPLPLWDDYKDLIKSGDADIKNSSGKRYAHPIVGGIFLKEFIDDEMPWAHLDIAGVATTDDEKAATGFGVRLLIEYLRRRSGA